MLKIFKKLLVLKHTAEAEGTEWFDSLEMTIMVLRELELERTVWGIGKRKSPDSQLQQAISSSLKKN